MSRPSGPRCRRSSAADPGGPGSAPAEGPASLALGGILGAGLALGWRLAALGTLGAFGGLTLLTLELLALGDDRLGLLLDPRRDDGRDERLAVGDDVDEVAVEAEVDADLVRDVVRQRLDANAGQVVEQRAAGLLDRGRLTGEHERDLDLHLDGEADEEIVDMERLPAQRVALDALDEPARRGARPGEAKLHDRGPARGAVERVERLRVDLDVRRGFALAVDNAWHDPGSAEPLVRLALRLACVEGELQVHRWW